MKKASDTAEGAVVFHLNECAHGEMIRDCFLSNRALTAKKKADGSYKMESSAIIIESSD